jgi:hypothetical protein
MNLVRHPGGGITRGVCRDATGTPFGSHYPGKVRIVFSPGEGYSMSVSTVL